ncbi:serine/threonine-protein kinase RsbT [bacterium BMS3Abin07]|nr:serine/threonine-protein kinase RsbT [bacterium BMS3Abin07]GBE32479.1 serine/threonine-protein kinase RsbT [bacterium BMS3Bbin05]HDO21670.1 anti-sigma regulatory factor [Nitrospirota bacterium]HDZ88511.1 anti-sigma regulatory factor [Nitrospirota bacterium]
MDHTRKIDGRFNLVGGDFTNAGEASTQLKKILQLRGVKDSYIRRASIATFEAEMNVIIYTPAGILRYDVDDESIKITVEDMGPGIEDIDLAMQEGYSTAPEWVREMGWGAGMGLPNMKKNSDVFRIDSAPGEGTTVKMIIYLNKGEQS